MKTQITTFYRLTNEEREKMKAEQKKLELINSLYSMSQKEISDELETIKYRNSKEQDLLNVLLPYMDNLMNIGIYYCIYFLDNPRYKNDIKLRKK